MKVLLDSYNTALQPSAGGVQTKVMNHLKDLNDYNISAKLFNKWEDKLSSFDIIHLFKLEKEYYDLILYAKKIGIKVVLSSIIPQENPKRIVIGRALNRIIPFKNIYSLSLSILNNCDCIIAETSLEKEFIMSAYHIPEHLISVIPNAVEDYSLGADKELFKKTRGIKSDFILVAGRFDCNKNQLSIIRALKNTNIPVVFIGGPGAGSENYYQQCIKEASQTMIFEGWMDRSNPLYRSAFSSAKVVALPSFREIFGNTIFEGAMAGANVVATKAIPINEWGLERMIVQIDPARINSIREGLIKALTAPINPELKKKAKDFFSREAVISKYLDIYNRLINA